MISSVISHSCSPYIMLNHITNLRIVLVFSWGSKLRLCIAMGAETFGYMGRGLSVVCLRSLPYREKMIVILISMAV